MPVNKDELIKDLDNPEYVEVVTKTLATKKIEVLDEKAKTTLLENHKREVLEKDMKVEVEKIHSQYDKDLAEVFPGYKRESNEKTYEAMKRVGKQTIEQLNTKITQLEADIKKGDPTGALTKKLQETEELAKKTIGELNIKITELSKGNEEANKTAKFAEVYGGVKAKFIKTLPAMFNQTEKALNASILANAVLKDGVLYVGDGSGGIKKDASFKEITVEDQLLGEYKDVIDTRKTQGGAGSGAGGGKPPANQGADPSLITKDNFEMPATAKGPDDLMSHLLELGVPRGTKNFNEIWSKYVDPKTNKLRATPA